MTANVNRSALASRRFIAVLEGKDASSASEIVGYARTPEACLAVAARCLDARRWSPSTACGRHIVHPDGFKAVSVLSVADAVRERIVAADAKARGGGDVFIKAIAIDGPAGAGKTSTAKALASRLPVIAYKPQAVISQAIYRIADKICMSQEQAFSMGGADSFELAASEAEDDFSAKLSFIEDLVGSGALTMGELAETIKQQQYELTQLKKENTLLKSKLIKASQQGFRL